MKIAVASEGEMVAKHFRNCENFNIYDTEYDNITYEKSVPNPGHDPCLISDYLSDLGVKVVISGGMVGEDIEIFNENGIVVVTEASGETKNSALDYLNGRLALSDTVCQQHRHHDGCGH